MSQSAITFFQNWFSMCWEFFSIPVPGFGITFKQLYLGILTVSVSIAILYKLFGLGGSISIGIHQSINQARNRRSYRERTLARNEFTKSYQERTELMRKRSGQ